MRFDRDMAKGMSPSIFSLPCMKAMGPGTSPVEILPQSSTAALKVHWVYPTR